MAPLTMALLTVALHTLAPRTYSLWLYYTHFGSTYLKAFSEYGDVLLAYEMNGEPLPAYTRLTLTLTLIPNP